MTQFTWSHSYRLLSLLAAWMCFLWCINQTFTKGLVWFQVTQLEEAVFSLHQNLTNFIRRVCLSQFPESLLSANYSCGSWRTSHTRRESVDLSTSVWAHISYSHNSSAIGRDFERMRALYTATELHNTVLALGTLCHIHGCGLWSTTDCIDIDSTISFTYD